MSDVRLSCQLNYLLTWELITNSHNPLSYMAIISATRQTTLNVESDTQDAKIDLSSKTVILLVDYPTYCVPKIIRSKVKLRLEMQA